MQLATILSSTLSKASHSRAGLESIKKSSTPESSSLAISTLYLEGEGMDHTCAVSDVPSRVELSSFIDSSPDLPKDTELGARSWIRVPAFLAF